MPTLLGLPDAVSPGATDKLWLTQGTGTDRDKQVEAGNLISGSMASVVAGFSAPSALTGAETVPLLQSATMKEMPISDVFKGYALDLTLVTARFQNNTADATMAASDAGGSWIRVGASPGGNGIILDAQLNFVGRSASASNASECNIRMTSAAAALPAAIAAKLMPGTDYIRRVPVVVLRTLSIDVYSGILEWGGGHLYFRMYTAAPAFAIAKWQDVQPINDTITQVSAQFFLVSP